MSNNCHYKGMRLTASLLMLVASHSTTAEVKQPSMAFLNFLAEQQEVNGELIGAIDMQQQALPKEQLSTKIKDETKQTTPIQAKNNDEVDDNEPQ